MLHISASYGVSHTVVKVFIT